MIGAVLTRAAGALLADGGNTPADIDPTTGHGPEWGKAAPIGLLVIVLLCVACYFLARSFSRNIRKVPKSFDQPDGLDGGDAPDGATELQTSEPAAGSVRGEPGSTGSAGTTRGPVGSTKGAGSSAKGAGGAATGPAGAARRRADGTGASG